MKVRSTLSVLGVIACLLVIGCHRTDTSSASLAQDPKRNAALTAQVDSQLVRLTKLKRYDTEAQQYVADCMASSDFRTQARIVPFLTQAWKLGLVKAPEIEAKYKEMAKRNVPNAPYWNAALKHAQERESKMVGG